MKTTNILTGTFGLLSAAVPQFSNAQTNLKPNIIIIYADDMGYGDISCYGAMALKTPNIDRVAGNGLRFTNAHCTSATSTPSRYSLLTGEYAWRRKGTGILPGDASAIIKPGRITIASVLKDAGYTTGVVGKWHLGSDPTGFDHWEILPGQGNYYNPDFITKDGKHTEKGYVTELITEKCIKWLREAKNSGKPFMLMMHHKAPHREWELYDMKSDPQEMKNVYNDPPYASVRKNLQTRLSLLMKKYKDSEELARSFLPN